MINFGDMKLHLLLSRYMLGAVMVSLTLGLGSCGSSKKTTAKPATGQHPTHGTKPIVGPMHGHSGEKPTEKYQKDLVSTARKWIGTPYKWGGNTKEGADCSGFVLEVYRDAVGVKLPRTSYNMQEYCNKLEPDKLLIGDLVFFSSAKSGGKVAHVGMYIGNNRMIHSASSRGVIESSLDESYWVKYYHSVGRVPAIAQMLPGRNKPTDTPQAQGERQLALTTSPQPIVSKARKTKHSSKKQTKTDKDNDPPSPHSSPVPKTEVSITLNEMALMSKQVEPTTPAVTPPAVTPSAVTPTPVTPSPVQDTPQPSQPQDSPDESPETMVANAFAGIKAQ